MNKELPDGWWRDPDLLRAEYQEHGRLSRAAQAHGTSKETLAKWWTRHGFEQLPRGPVADVPTPDETDEWLLAALKKLGDNATVEALADHADVSPRRVREAAERLGSRGYRISEGEHVTLERHPTETGERFDAAPELFDGDEFRFGITSDVHAGSKAEHPEWWETAYSIFEQRGIRTVYDPGDLVDGLDIYRTQNTEVKFHTYEQQVEHAANTHPSRPGIVTYRIGGNHDLEGAFGKAGADPVQAVANVREDIVYLGRYSAWVDLPNGATMHLLHPMGGASYATSYRPQKIVEAYQGGDKPNILVIGHWHRTGFFVTRGVQTILAGTFQGPTTYSVRKALGEPGFGFWIIEGRLADDGSVVGLRPEWFPFYPGRVST